MKIQKQITSWMSETLEGYEEQLVLSKSATTVAAYRRDVTCFFEYLMKKGVKRLGHVRGDHVISYLGYCKAEGKSDASLNRYYMAIRSYCRYLRKARLIGVDLTDDVTPPRTRLKAPRIPSVHEIERIVTAPGSESESGVRDRAILELLYSSGLRASELCDLELEDFREDSVLVQCGKRGKTRSVPLTGEAARAINDYVDRYRGKDAGYLFITMGGKQLRRQLLCKLVCLYAKKAGVDGVTTHTMRHACATHLLDQGADIRMIQEVLGHSSIASTQRYTHLSSNKIMAMFKNFHPRKNAHA